MERPDVGLPPTHTNQPRLRLGKADAERLLAAVDDDEALRAVLAAVLRRLVAEAGPTTWAELVSSAAPVAGWDEVQCALLAGDGTAAARARVALAVELAERRRLD